MDSTTRTVRLMRGGLRLRVALALLAMAAISVMALSGCATQKAGAAAVAGDDRLTESQLTELYDELDNLYAANPEAQRLPDDQLTLSVLSWWINEQLIGAIAEQEELSATQAQIDEVLGGGQEQLDAISLGNGIPPSRLEAAAEVFVLSSAITESLSEPGSTPEQTDAALVARLQATADELGISVSPRFGTWNSETVSVEPRDPDRLSSPVGGTTEAPALDLPGQQ